jgi:hypothetical protein
MWISAIVRIRWAVCLCNVGRTECLAKNARRRRRRDPSALTETSVVEFRQQLQRVRLRLVMIDKQLRLVSRDHSSNPIHRSD